MEKNISKNCEIMFEQLLNPDCSSSKILCGPSEKYYSLLEQSNEQDINKIINISGTRNNREFCTCGIMLMRRKTYISVKC